MVGMLRYCRAGKRLKRENEGCHPHDDLSMDQIKMEMQNEQIKVGQQVTTFREDLLSSILANHYPITPSDVIKDTL
jgi:hypothetical protein